MHFLDLKLIVVLISTQLLTGCMVGPDFHSPAAPRTASYTEASTPNKTIATQGAGKAGKAQAFIAGRDLPEDWWRLFHSTQINQLISKGLANSPNLAAAKAVLTQAQETWYAQTGSTMLPAVDGQLGAQRQRGSKTTTSTSTSSIFNLFNASVNVSYTLDMFGALRRQLEASYQQVQFQQYELEAAYLTLTSNIVTTSIATASLRAQIQATQDLIKEQTSILHILKQQFKLGAAAETDVLTQETLLNQTKATLPPLQQNLAQNLHALSVLTGELPSEDQLPRLELNELVLPTQLPISVPSKLVRQRPDIRASEALLHAACAQVGVATANLYPQLTITGAYGWENATAANLIKPANVVWNIAAGLTGPIFNGGALMAKQRAAEAGFQQAAAQYRQTVLQGFQNVADSLRALQNDAQLLHDQTLAEVSAQKSLNLTLQQYHLGSISYLNLLNAEKQYQQTKISRIQAQAARYTDTVALFQAIGGGWS